ncbi:MAG TPA: hypothetical protein DIT64_16850 [Verrucomicrobiales bacterium]|nr:hypothetical protein [Verrucomicrobiales bacterium]
MADTNSKPASTATRSRKTPGAKLAGMNALALLEGAMGGGSTDWEPPEAAELEPDFKGYRDFQFIDRGGMGAVYSAVQESLERRVAVKILPPEMALDAAFVERFNQEARLLAKLQHPHIVAVYDFGSTAAGHLFIVMEYVEGESLLEVMKKRRLPVTEVLDIIAQVCDALQFAHDRGVIHRDIKPTNILMDEKGAVRVADFGLAKLAAATPPTTSTRTGMIMGTPGYAAPEQRRADTLVDHRADIFSTGATLYEMLTGHLPVGVFVPPSKKSGAPPSVDKIVFKALQELPADRFQRASDMRAAIATVMLRLGTPLVKHTIITRPMVSMMSCVIIGMGFIYLLDAINNELRGTRAPLHAALTTELAVSDAMLVQLDAEYAVVRARFSWEDASRHIDDLAGWKMAEFHSDEQRLAVAGLLKERGITSPLWIGGYETENGGHAWISGAPFDHAAWMPAAPEPPPIITEIQPKNETTLVLPSGTSPDWFEVFNPGTLPVDLTGYHLKHYTSRVVYDGRLGPAVVKDPESLVLQPGGRLVVYCHSDIAAQVREPCFPFHLSAPSGRVVWLDPRGRVIQNFEQNWQDFPADASLGCDDDGTRWGWRAKATPGAPNSPLEALSHQPVDMINQPRAILMLPEFDCRWTLNPTRRGTWSLVRRVNEPRAAN